MADKVWDSIERLDECEIARDKRRVYGNMTFDCFNAIVKGNKVFCSKGKHLAVAKDGSMLLVSVLMGRSGLTCRKCGDHTH